MSDQILVELQESMGSDRSIANAAWTSTYNKDLRESKYDDSAKVANIVERLIKDGHGTPIESVIFRFWIRMPIFTDRQHQTHRIQSSNGLSGRYRTMPLDWYKLPRDVKLILQEADEELIAIYEDSCQIATKNYKHSIEELKKARDLTRITDAEFKRAREVLRGQLPTAGMVERTTIMNLRSFANYQKQRNSDHAQPEIRIVAQKMLEAVKAANICPVAIKTLESIGWQI